MAFKKDGIIQINMENKIFAELNGFVIYNPFLLERYLRENSLDNKDVLAYFTETEHGEIITQNGIAIPIIGLPDDYYSFYLYENNPQEVNDKIVESLGWIYNAEGGIVKIVGIGYLKDMSFITENNSLTFSLAEGWKKLSLYSVFKDEAAFVMKFENSLTKPGFSGDVETNYGFEW